MVEDKKLLVDVAHLYYEKQMTQQQIAKQLNVSRSLISKMLVKSRDIGVVEVIIHDDTVHIHKELEEKMKHLFQMKDIVCVEQIAGKTMEESVVSYACKYIESRCAKINSVAMAGGKMMKEIARSFSPKISMEHVDFIPLCGGIDEEFWDAQANTVCDYMASRCTSSSSQLHGPLILESREARDMLLEQSFIAKIIEKAKDAKLALVGIGSATQYEELENHYLKENQKMTQDQKRKIKGDIIYHFYDEKGELIDCAWNRQTVSLGFDDLKNIPEVIGVAYEMEKAESIYIAIREKMIDSLIIPAKLAKQILKLHSKYL